MNKSESSSLEMVTHSRSKTYIVEGVGKSSIIITLASETFPRTLKEKTYHPVIISSDLYMLPINTSTILLDSSCKLCHLIFTN